MNARRFFRLICFSLLFVSPASGYCQSPVAQPNLGIKKLAFEVPTDMITTSYLSGTMKVAASDIYVVNFPDLKPKKLAAGSNPAWSPDGEQIAFCVRKGTGFGQLQVANADGSRQRAISQIQKGACDPDWSPDGLKIAFTLYGGKAPGIYVVGSSGGDAIQIAEGYAAHWSPDGTKLIFMGPGQKDLVSAHHLDSQCRWIRSENTVSCGRINRGRSLAPKWEGHRLLFPARFSSGCLLDESRRIEF